MKKTYICTFIISLFISFNSIGQNSKKDSIKIDSVPKVKQKYGIRIGMDISKPIISFFENQQKGFEIVGDVRFKKNYYIATELGYASKDTKEDFLDFTTKGTFLRVGVNRNLYENWGEMNNEIYVGARYGISFFSHTLRSYTPHVTPRYFIPVTNTNELKFEGLSAHWFEFVFGMKVETLKNLFLGMNIQFKYLVHSKEPNNFKNLYIPGFQDVSANELGFGFNYTISYLIPIIKK